jgi:hypothetical protein
MLLRRHLTALAIALLPTFSVAAVKAVPVTLTPGDDIQAAVDAHPPGTLYMLQSGTYRMQSIVPKTGDVFDGQGAAVLNGSRLLTAFERIGTLWAAPDQTRKGYVLTARLCQQGFPRCSRPEDLFINDKPLRHVDSVHEVTPGTWYFDYRNNKVYLADDPAGKTVEIGVTPRAFGGEASNVIVRNLTVEKYAAPISAIDAEYGDAWIVENNLVRLMPHTLSRFRNSATTSRDEGMTTSGAIVH